MLLAGLLWLIDPFGLRQLDLTFACVDAMFRQKQRRTGPYLGQSREETGVPRTDGVIKTCAGQRRLQQREEGQMGGAKRPEEIDQRTVGGTVTIAFEQQIPAFRRMKEIGNAEPMRVLCAQALHQAGGIAGLPGRQRLVKLLKAVPHRRRTPRCGWSLRPALVLNEQFLQTDDVGRHVIAWRTARLGPCAEVHDRKGEFR